MTQVIALLQTALALLSFMGTANVPEDIKTQAIAIAQSAVSMANEEIAKIGGSFNIPTVGPSLGETTVTVPITTNGQTTNVTVTNGVAEPVPSFLLLNFGWRTGNGDLVYRVETTSPVDFSKTEFIAGIFSPDIKSGACSSKPDGITDKVCMDWSITEILPITVTSVKEIKPADPDANYCNNSVRKIGMDPVCNYPRYEITLSEPLFNFINQQSKVLPLKVKFVSKLNQTIQTREINLFERQEFDVSRID